MGGIDVAFLRKVHLVLLRSSWAFCGGLNCKVIGWMAFFVYSKYLAVLEDREFLLAIAYSLRLC